MAGKYLSLLIHFVWSTKNREPWIAREWSDNLYAYIGGTLRKKKAKLICAGGISDHIHIYASLPSTPSTIYVSGRVPYTAAQTRNRLR